MSDIKDIKLSGSLETLHVKDADARDRLDALESWKDVLFSVIYPVGSTYITTDKDFDPSVVFGGVWSRIAQGKALVGVDETSSITNMKSYVVAGFGSANSVLVSHNHSASASATSLTANSAGAHSHTGQIRGRADDNGGSGYHGYVDYVYSGGYNSGWSTTGAVSIGSNGAHTHSINAHGHTITVNSNGVSATNTNYQPSVAVYIWRCDSR